MAQLNVYPPNPTVDPCNLVLKFVDLENNVFVDEAGEEVAMAVTLGTDRTHLSVANSYSRGDREFEKATAMLFPSEIAQRGRMRDHTAAH